MDIFMPYKVRKMTNILNEVTYTITVFDPITGHQTNYKTYEEDIPKGFTLNEYIEKIYFYNVNRSHIYGNFNTVFKPYK